MNQPVFSPIANKRAFLAELCLPTPIMYGSNMRSTRWCKASLCRRACGSAAGNGSLAILETSDGRSLRAQSLLALRKTAQTAPSAGALAADTWSWLKLLCELREIRKCWLLFYFIGRYLNRCGFLHSVQGYIGIFPHMFYVCI